jgi:hypothetical protein
VDADVDELEDEAEKEGVPTEPDRPPCTEAPDSGDTAAGSRATAQSEPRGRPPTCAPQRTGADRHGHWTYRDKVSRSAGEYEGARGCNRLSRATVMSTLGDGPRATALSRGWWISHGDGQASHPSCRRAPLCSAHCDTAPDLGEYMFRCVTCGETLQSKYWADRLAGGDAGDRATPGYGQQTGGAGPSSEAVAEPSSETVGGEDESVGGGLPTNAASTDPPRATQRRPAKRYASEGSLLEDADEASELALAELQRSMWTFVETTGSQEHPGFERVKRVAAKAGKLRGAVPARPGGNPARVRG